MFVRKVEPLPCESFEAPSAAPALPSPSRCFMICTTCTSEKLVQPSANHAPTASLLLANDWPSSSLCRGTSRHTTTETSPNLAKNPCAHPLATVLVCQHASSGAEVLSVVLLSVQVDDKSTWKRQIAGLNTQLIFQPFSLGGLEHACFERRFNSRSCETFGAEVRGVESTWRKGVVERAATEFCAECHAERCLLHCRNTSGT